MRLVFWAYFVFFILNNYIVNNLLVTKLIFDRYIIFIHGKVFQKKFIFARTIFFTSTTRRETDNTNIPQRVDGSTSPQSSKRSRVDSTHLKETQQKDKSFQIIIQVIGMKFEELIL